MKNEILFPPLAGIVMNVILAMILKHYTNVVNCNKCYTKLWSIFKPENTTKTKKKTYHIVKMLYHAKVKALSIYFYFRLG